MFLVLGCDGFAASRGKITDERGKPIEDAKIILDVDDGEQKFEGKSSAAGNYDLGGAIAPFKSKVKLTVMKEGCQASEEIFQSQNELKGEHNVILKKN